MTFVVLDASVALKWYVEETDIDKASALLEADDLFFLAPDIFISEVVNALLKQRRAGQLTDELMDEAVLDLHFAAPELVASHHLTDRAIVLARALTHPICDCLYLSLAERWDTVMVTADERFVKRCRHQLSEDPATKRLRLLSEFSL